MITRRTREQRVANEFDRDLYRLIGMAETCAAETRDQGWKNVIHHLRNARPFVREKMHDKDRAETI